MTLTSYRRALNALTIDLAKQVGHLLALLPARPSTSQWAAFTGALFPTVQSGRLHASLEAQRFYLDQRAAAGITDAPPTFLPQRYEPAMLDKSLTRVTKTRLNADAGRGLIVAETTAELDKHIRAAAHGAIVQASDFDNHALGFARAMTGAENCAFCLMLASRGPVYKTAKSATLRADGRTFHERCDCMAVPVYDRENWEGRDEYLAAKKFYEDNAQGADDPLNSLRRALYAQQKDTAASAESAAA